MKPAAVSVDSQDRVYCFNRNAEHPVVVFDRDGKFLSSWGAGLFKFPHAIRIRRAGTSSGSPTSITTSSSNSPPTASCCRPSARRAQRSDTGVPDDDFSSAAWKKVTHGGGPFNLPTDIAFAPDGSMFMTDGYGNARVHKFSADAKYLFSWGEPGNAPGQFNLPHGVWIDRRGRVLVADRENDRVQVFDQDGKLLEVWPTELIGPAFFYVDDGRHRLYPRAQWRHDQHPDARWRAAGALGRSDPSLLPRHLGRFARRYLCRAAGRMGTRAARREIRAAVKGASVIATSEASATRLFSLRSQ